MSAYESRFHHNLGALRAYAMREGHCDVPYSHVEPHEDHSVPLGRWVAYLRTRHRSGRLHASRVAMLEAVVGWHWNVRKPGPRPKEDRNHEIRALRSQGISLATIAETYGISKQRIHQLTRSGR